MILVCSMCVIAIVDKDSLLVLATRGGHGDKNFLSWIENRHGILAFCDTKLYPNEIINNRAILELFARYEQGGQLRKFRGKEISEAEKKIPKRGQGRRSNDSYILALALVSGARVLCSNDKKLHSDFKNVEILPKIGKKRRNLYPMNGTRKQRSEFLHRHRCANREQT